ncbi:MULTISPECIES: peptidoglycan DD-metalloendopeptidase family protein [unclassified Enterococcus]|uniref:peptidoglycan DD-metalloendopeptidase family protein n=1 Tax=unclassified Enterococcus TaxID=2608891 RepID=UPI002159B0BC|nr:MULTISPECIES: peptidoglycan DD-metalloendopeptidase family protein [unclassified Enterococcus]
MEQSRKWLALLLVCSQFITSLPASAAMIENDGVFEEEVQVEAKDPKSQPEETPSESEKLPVDEMPVEPENPQEVPEEIPTAPKPETPVLIDPPKQETIPEHHPQPDQTKDQETGSEEEQSVPEVQDQTKLPEIAECQSINEPSFDFVITPEKETWEFIKGIGEDAWKIGLEEDLYGSVMIAQAILESASGQSELSQAPYHNLFGIKGTVEGKGVTFKTQEDDGSGNLYTIDATFRQYEDYEATFKDYAKLLKEGLAHDSDFYKGTWKSETESYEDATDFLTGRYATDTQYGEKLNALIEAYALTSYDKEKAALPEGTDEMIHPVMNPVVSSTFGPRGDGFHRGIDFAAPLGTPILASLAGTVIRSEYHNSWGNYVAIEHENGLTTLYAHNNQNLVTVGQTVAQGEIIASMGSTGNSTGPHLHFEVSLSPSLAQDQLIDPLRVLPSNE